MAQRSYIYTLPKQERISQNRCEINLNEAFLQPKRFRTNMLLIRRFRSPVSVPKTDNTGQNRKYYTYEEDCHKAEWFRSSTKNHTYEEASAEHHTHDKDGYKAEWFRSSTKNHTYEEASTEHLTHDKAGYKAEWFRSST